MSRMSMASIHICIHMAEYVCVRIFGYVLMCGILCLECAFVMRVCNAAVCIVGYGSW